jgi:two-component system NtrC family sensor kinase
VADDRLRLRRFIRPEALKVLETAGVELAAPVGGLAVEAFEAAERAVAQAEERTIDLERLAQLGQVSAGLTHEVRNVMTGVLGFAQVAMNRLDDRPEAVAELLTQIEQELGRCLDILNHFLGFTRRDAATQARLQPEEIVSAVVRLVRHQLAMSHVQLEVDVPSSLPTVRGNADALKQVILNLVQNAMQAMPDGGTVRIKARADGARVRIELSDTGPGIPEDVRARLFEPFFTTKPRGEGSGLGLYISNCVMQAHDGRLWAVSAADHPRGACFVIELPAETSQAKAPAKKDG